MYILTLIWLITANKVEFLDVTSNLTIISLLIFQIIISLFILDIYQLLTKINLFITC